MSLLQNAAPALVLASASAARRAVLAGAGLQFTVAVSGVDEGGIKNTSADPATTALALARAKAAAITAPGAIVIGCDQILLCESTCFDKPADLTAARAQLLALSGKPHDLITAICAYKDGTELWHHIATPTLTMRQFSAAFLTAYLAAEGDAVLTSVGAYRLEGPGAHLFSQIEGEHAAILGLPLIALLDFLRGHGVVLA